MSGIAFALAPLLVTAGAACVALLLGVLLGARFRAAVTWLSVAALAAVVLVAALALPGSGRAQPILSEMWVADRMALIFDLVIAVVAGMSLLLFASFSREHDFERDEFPALVLLVAAPPQGRGLPTEGSLCDRLQVEGRGFILAARLPVQVWPSPWLQPSPFPRTRPPYIEYAPSLSSSRREKSRASRCSCSND